MSSTITKVAGPLVKAKGMSTAKMFEVVRVSKENLMGEVIVAHCSFHFFNLYYCFFTCTRRNGGYTKETEAFYCFS